MISPITNVNITPNKVINFGSGVQTNHGLHAPSSSNNMVEGGLLTGFVGTVSPLFRQTQSRAQSIQEGLNVKKINFLA